MPIPIQDNAEPSLLQTPSIEREHVHRVYETIASHWDRTRHSPWPRVKDFLSSLSRHSIIADVGCGNGKYMSLLPHSLVLGCDRSINLMKICASNNQQVTVSDNMTLPYRDGVFDAVLSIAVLHHISTPARRARAVSELFRLLRVGGRVLIYAWALEQGSESRREFPGQDVLVPWVHHIRQGDIGVPTDYSDQSVLQRYCHVFREGELEQLVTANAHARIDVSYYDTSNWCVAATKLE